MLESAGLVVAARGGLFHGLLPLRGAQALRERYRPPTSVPTGIGAWQGGERLTKALTMALDAEARVSLALATRSLPPLPGPDHVGLLSAVVAGGLVTDRSPMRRSSSSPASTRRAGSTSAPSLEMAATGRGATPLRRRRLDRRHRRRSWPAWPDASDGDRGLHPRDQHREGRGGPPGAPGRRSRRGRLSSGYYDADLATPPGELLRLTLELATPTRAVRCPRQPGGPTGQLDRAQRACATTWAAPTPPSRPSPSGSPCTTPSAGPRSFG